MQQNKWRLCFLTLFFSGKSPKASGTVGSVVAWFLALPILCFSTNTLFLLALLIGAVAVKQIDAFEQEGGEHDDKSIVIDELVGLWIALSFIPSTSSSSSHFWIGAGVALVFFRIFDIWKPSLVGVIDRRIKGGLGVVGDDALAGVLAGLLSAGILQLLDLVWV